MGVERNVLSGLPLPAGLAMTAPSEPLSSACVAHITTACELELQEHSKATVNSSSVELRGAACSCGKLQAAPKAGCAAWNWDVKRQCCVFTQMMTAAHSLSFTIPHLK